MKISIPRDRFLETSVHRLSAEISELRLSGFPQKFDIQASATATRSSPSTSSAMKTASSGCVTVSRSAA